MNILRPIDEIEQLAEEGQSMPGKRLVPEAAFFDKMQQLRAALPQALKDAESSASVAQLSANPDELSRGDKLRLIARWGAELARDEP